MTQESKVQVRSVVNGAGESPHLSVVVPTYEEAENLPLLIMKVHGVLKDMPWSYELLVVDDNSMDGTTWVMREMEDEGYPVRLITRRRGRDLSRAVMFGFRRARGDIFVCMDADLSHSPSLIPRLLEAIEEGGVDLVFGSRYSPGGRPSGLSVPRLIASKLLTFLVRPLTDVSDPMSGFFALRREVFEEADELNPCGYKIGLELLVKGAYDRKQEVPIVFAPRRLGHSKVNVREIWKFIVHLKRLVDYRFGLFSRLFQFCIVGGTGMAVDLTFLSILLFFTVPFMYGRAASILVAMTWNFALNRYVTFHDRKRIGLLKEYSQFVASCSLGAVLNWGTSVLLMSVLPPFLYRFIVAAMGGIIAGTGSNFVLSNFWVFPIHTREHPHPHHTDDDDTEEAPARG